jgi:peptidoglycan hydrolase-like protein with peptidoglycan-binding domain
MAVKPRLIFLIGAIAFLGACSDEQVTPLQARPTYSPDPAIVRKVQIALRERGYYAGLVDGFLGQNTAIGIQRFQVDHDQIADPVIDRSLLVSLGIRSYR